jgi:hypothetical protein
MKEFFVGLAIIILLSTLTKAKVRVEGLFGLLIFSGVCWGFGKLFFMLLGRS